MARNLAELQRRIDLRVKNVTGEAFRKLHARVARRELAEVQRAQAAANGLPAPFERFVDGVKGRSEDEVKLYGVISYLFSHAADVAAWIYEQLLRRSPVGPAEGGHYRDDHRILVNGAEVADLRGVKAGDEIAFVNLRPYARKLELGSSMQAPNGIYQVTAKDARTRFRNGPVIEFTYRGFSGVAVDRSKAGNKAAVRYPTIIIRDRR